MNCPITELCQLKKYTKQKYKCNTFHFYCTQTYQPATWLVCLSAVMVWAGFLKAQQYCDEILRFIAMAFIHAHHVMLQHDNALPPCKDLHTSPGTSQFLHGHVWEALDCCIACTTVMSKQHLDPSQLWGGWVISAMCSLTQIYRFVNNI